MNNIHQILLGNGTEKSLQEIEHSEYNGLNLRDALVAFVMHRHNFQSKRKLLASPYLCYTCRLPLRLSRKKIKCSCNFVTYCSQVCRKKDNEHYESRLCRAFRNKDNCRECKNVNEFRQHRLIQLRELLRFDKSSGGITQLEKNIILYQRFCQYCFATPTKDRTIVPCPRCDQAGFCEGTECRSKAKEFHDRVCQDWSVSTRCEQLICRRFGQSLVWIPSELMHSYVKPPESWKEYFRLRHSPDFDACARAMITENLSIPMSALYAASKFLRLAMSKKLVIHFVGSSDKEAMYPFIYEEMLNYVPSLKQLEIVLIGPEMSSHDSVLLKSCSEKNGEIIIRSMCTAYETFVMDDTPDLIICCNSGIHYDSQELRYIEDQHCTPLKASWEPALKRMLQLLHVPLVFTSFNDWEIEQDFQRLKDFAADTTGVDISVLMKPKLNPYRSLHFKMDPWRSHSSYSANNCMFVCCGS